MLLGCAAACLVGRVSVTTSVVGVVLVCLVLRDLERLQGRQIEPLTLALENQLETVKRGRFEQRNQQIARVFDDYRQWVQDTLTTEPQPWIQVLAAVCHPQAALAATAGA